MRAVRFLVAALALVACSGGDDATGESSATAGGSAAPAPTSTVEIPATFPAEVPIPAGLVVERAEELAGQSSRLFNVTGWLDGEPVPSARAYLAELDALGYEVTSRTEAPDSLLFIAEGADWVVSAGFYADPIRNVGTAVGVTVTPAEPPIGEG